MTQNGQRQQDLIINAFKLTLRPRPRVHGAAGVSARAAGALPPAAMVLSLRSSWKHPWKCFDGCSCNSFVMHVCPRPVGLGLRLRNRHVRLSWECKREERRCPTDVLEKLCDKVTQLSRATSSSFL